MRAQPIAKAGLEKHTKTTTDPSINLDSVPPMVARVIKTKLEPKRFASQVVLKDIRHSLIYSDLLYCISIWANTRNELIDIY